MIMIRMKNRRKSISIYYPNLGKIPLLKSICNKQRVTRQFNLRVKARPIHVGDWVISKVKATVLTHLEGKLGPKWDGPYKVTPVIKPETYRLESMEGTPLARPWNVDNLRNTIFDEFRM